MSETELTLLPGDGDDMEAPGPDHPAWRGLAEHDDDPETTDDEEQQ